MSLLTSPSKKDHQMSSLEADSAAANTNSNAWPSGSYLIWTTVRSTPTIKTFANLAHDATHKNGGHVANQRHHGTPFSECRRPPFHSLWALTKALCQHFVWHGLSSRTGDEFNDLCWFWSSNLAQLTKLDLITGTLFIRGEWNEDHKEWIAAQAAYWHF